MFRVNDEKESRQYLEELTRLLKDDIDQIKQTVLIGSGSGSRRSADVTWQHRRNNKVDKKELLQLTSSLDMEIKAKEAVIRELNEAREKVLFLAVVWFCFTVVVFNASLQILVLEEKIDESEQQLQVLNERLLYPNNYIDQDQSNELRDNLNGIDNGYLTINTCGTVSRNVSDVSFLRFLNDPMAALGQSYPSESSVDLMDRSPRSATPVADPTVTVTKESEYQTAVADLHSSAAPPIPAKVPLTSQNLVPSATSPNSESQQSSTPTEGLSPHSYNGNQLTPNKPPLPSPTGSTNSYASRNAMSVHKFEGHTLLEPTKCCHCVSLMLGTARQAVKCVSCGYMCHPRCVDKLQPNICPMPQEQMNPHFGIDPKTGIGTAYEGFVKIPRSGGGVKKGWMRQYAVTCDYKFFLFDCVESGSKGANNSQNSTNSGCRKTLKISECIDMK